MADVGSFAPVGGTGVVITIGEGGREIDNCGSLECPLGDVETGVGEEEVDGFNIDAGVEVDEADLDRGDEEEATDGTIMNPLLDGTVWVVGGGSGGAVMVGEDANTFGLGETELVGEEGTLSRCGGVVCFDLVVIMSSVDAGESWDPWDDEADDERKGCDDRLPVGGTNDDCFESGGGDDDDVDGTSRPDDVMVEGQ